VKYRSVQATDRPSRSFLLRLEAGDTVMDALTTFAREEKIGSATFTAIGAFESTTLAFFHRDSKEYEELPDAGQCEVLSFVGNLSWFNEAPRVHAHAMLGREDGSVVGGHFVDATVWPTLEVSVTAWDTTVDRAVDPDSTLPLLAL
jgi:predicted DNA-binding protein with PD1-like motif